ncbi:MULTISPECIES: hypothetical protein [Citrobacter]|uniref:hypothetical protein n=1 Tax=Citrobacter TaxID=544 RepID=UPI000F8D8E34|nr:MULTISPECIES: hypothetical protein [Citrobacter]EHU7373819.1 hypothetical protein [Citrobacter freundii]MDG9960274.1 hypothetical protein [Citrobacter portucalensis]MDM2810229.1 hypothetical protein [Citrobacter sp. Cpo103]MDN4357494.1 hypothetical protein [Citrobacter portucalensis]MDN4366123.1 hypothetical protein [Citrobacter portucalensis]
MKNTALALFLISGAVNASDNNYSNAQKSFFCAATLNEINGAEMAMARLNNQSEDQISINAKPKFQQIDHYINYATEQMNIYYSEKNLGAVTVSDIATSYASSISFVSILPDYPGPETQLHYVTRKLTWHMDKYSRQGCETIANASKNSDEKEVK